MRKPFTIIIPLTTIFALLAGCWQSAGSSRTIDQWATYVTARDFSNAERMMQDDGMGIWSWREDTTHWNKVWDGMKAYEVVEGPVQAGASQNYTLKWLWNNGKEQCLKVQITADERVLVVGDYRRCLDSQ